MQANEDLAWVEELLVIALTTTNMITAFGKRAFGTKEYVFSDACRHEFPVSKERYDEYDIVGA